MSPERNELPPMKDAAPTIPSPACGRGLGRGQQALNNAKSLRTNQTDAEQRLWYHLRAHRFMDLKFKRQKPMGSYVVDFVCVERRLIIELDGGQHAEQENYDQHRDAWLRGQGYTVLRFWNNDVMQNLEGVLEKIRCTLALSPTPLPQAGEGRERRELQKVPTHESPRPLAGEG
jgi:very-short-patch-repair endonuclease